MSAPLVLKFSHLAKMPQPERALNLLEKIASLVKPVMKKHSWTLPLLSEFFPSNPSLLGMNKNAGQQILIRLRPAHSEDTFLELDDLMGTMLHELTHNIFGPHDDKFYAFLKVLTAEFDALIAGGYSGEGFLSNGTRVGVGVAHDLPPQFAKAKALAAAEERAKKQRLMGPGGKIGGVKKVGKTPRELAADAAERRMKDDKACGSAGGKAAEDEEVRQAARDGVVDVASQLQQPIDLDVDDLPSPPPPNLASSSSSSPFFSIPKALPNARPVPSSFKPVASSFKPTASPNPNPLKRSPPLPSPTLFRPPPPPPPPSNQWACPTCTFDNSDLLPLCEVCETQRPPPSEPEGTWRCERCGTGANEDGFWSCRTCGGIKMRS